MSHPAESAVQRFFEAWTKNDVTLASQEVQPSYCQSAEEPIRKWHRNRRKDKEPRPPMTVDAELRSKFEAMKLTGFMIVHTQEVSSVMADVLVAVNVKDSEPTLVLARVICEEGPFKPSINGKWGVNPTSLSRIRKA